MAPCIDRVIISLSFGNRFIPERYTVTGKKSGSAESAVIAIREKNGQLIIEDSNIKYFYLLHIHKPDPYPVIIYKTVITAHLNILIPDADSPLFEKLNSIPALLVYPFTHQCNAGTARA